jgi:hypothetical protein
MELHRTPLDFTKLGFWGISENIISASLPNGIKKFGIK